MYLPSASKYRRALQQIYSQISPIQWRLLEAHYLAPEHTASSHEMALAAGKSWRATNIHYGRLGTRLRSSLNMPLADGEQQSSVIASFQSPRDGYRFCQWIMHPPLASAIGALRWFESEDGDTYSNPAWNATEGHLERTLKIHRHRERSLRHAKIQAFRAENNGRLFCQVPGCGFDFELTYGEIGHGFAEVHHLKPLRELINPVHTTLQDLAIVCSNCHRMIHRNNSCLSLDEIIRIRSHEK